MNQIFAAGLALLAAVVLITWYVKSKRAQKVMELSDDLVLIPDRAKVKVDADGNVIRQEKPQADDGEQAEVPEGEAAQSRAGSARRAKAMKQARMRPGASCW